jgi:hypothetical protein
MASPHGPSFRQVMLLERAVTSLLFNLIADR